MNRIGSVQKTEKKIGIEQKNRGLAIKFFKKNRTEKENIKLNLLNYIGICVQYFLTPSQLLF